MENYDVVIIGAGPAGGQCARELAIAGKQVLLVEKSKNFLINNYSSGGAPLEIINDFALPKEIISSYWHKLSIFSSNANSSWISNKPLGVILDFMKLRKFLSNEAQLYGADLLMNCTFQNYEKIDDSIVVHIKNKDENQIFSLSTRILVDATGTERAVLNENFDKSKYLEAVGMEYHIEVSPDIHRGYEDKLSFYIGHKWMPQGYGWVFPMESNRLKVGIIRFFAGDHFISYESSYTYYMDQLISHCFGTTKLPVIDRHGKTLYYCYGQREPHFKENIIAVGDSISTLNPLAAEGIRHAMMSSKIAVKYILQYLDNKNGLSNYPKAIKKYYGLKWRLSEIIMNTLYKAKKDKDVDHFIHALKPFKSQEILDLCFHYKLSKIIKFYFNYILNRALTLH